MLLLFLNLHIGNENVKYKKDKQFKAEYDLNVLFIQTLGNILYCIYVTIPVTLSADASITSFPALTLTMKKM